MTIPIDFLTHQNRISIGTSHIFVVSDEKSKNYDNFRNNFRQDFYTPPQRDPDNTSPGHFKMFSSLFCRLIFVFAGRIVEIQTWPLRSSITVLQCCFAFVVVDSLIIALRDRGIWNQCVL